MNLSWVVYKNSILIKLHFFHFNSFELASVVLIFAFACYGFFDTDLVFWGFNFKKWKK